MAIDDLGVGQEPASKKKGVDLVCLNEALADLEQESERQARIVELRFLAGLTVEETAKVLECWGAPLAACSLTGAWHERGSNAVWRRATRATVLGGGLALCALSAC